MENPNTNVEMYGKFTWTITNFSTLDSEELYSDAFSLDGHIWRILIIQKGDLSIFLDAGVATMPHGWEKFANFRVILINQLNHKRNIIKDCSHTFNSKQGKWGFPSSISLGELWHSSRGFIVNDTCVIEAHILVHMLEHKKLVAESVRNIDNKLVESIENISPKEIISTSSFGEVVDFRDIGKVEKDFIPLLEEVCSQYPLLMDIKKKRSQRFTDWAFTALGRVLHFLNLKK
ncbi:Ubiquitin carboxyl-terminal hydrolase [Vigna angularis]|uniref:Ubiquitin carboxyl-terminal hydrolase n=1 Tax=Phaseolus angularis TaxID=3914 RepID=A0A8T0KVR0_PHAAN|nr:ubiquitin C-terminal hydrolase 13 [Vigna angularis]KAG2403511.1 Ubiquitin carboxyl-terminal hydrolase [Vigna angularis]